MASAFTKGGGDAAKASEAEIDKLHSIARQAIA